MEDNKSYAFSGIPNVDTIHINSTLNAASESNEILDVRNKQLQSNMHGHRDLNQMVQNKVDANNDVSEVLHSQVINKQDSDTRESITNVESQRNLVSNAVSSNAVRITITEKTSMSKTVKTDALSNLKENKELAEDMVFVKSFPHSEVDDIGTPISIVKPEEQIRENLPVGSESSAFNTKHGGTTHEISNDKIESEDIESKNKMSVDTAEISCQEKSVTKPASTNDQESFTNNDNYNDASDYINENDTKSSNPNEKVEEILGTNEPTEQIETKTSCGNDVVEDLNSITRGEDNPNLFNQDVEQRTNIENLSRSTSENQHEIDQEMSNENNLKPSIVSNLDAGPMQNGSDAPTEIINTNYVVEITLLDPKNKTTSPQKSIPDNGINVNTGATSMNNIGGLNNTRSGSEIVSTGNKEFSNSAKGTVDINSKEYTEPVLVQSNINKDPPSDGDNKVDEQTNVTIGVNMYSTVSSSLPNEEYSTSLPQNINETNSSNVDVNKENFSDWYKDNFVHNDLVMTREKNTNLNREQSDITSVASCISVSNMKQLDTRPSVSSSVSSTANSNDSSGSSHISNTASVPSTSVSTSIPTITMDPHNSTAPSVSAANSNVSLTATRSSISTPAVSNTAPCISVTAPSSSAGSSNMYMAVSSPDCYVEEKSIAESIQNKFDNSSTAEAKQCEERTIQEGKYIPIEVGTFFFFFLNFFCVSLVFYSGLIRNIIDLWYPQFCNFSNDTILF